MKKARELAEILIEALPYIREFFNKTIVIKYGGHAMVDEGLKKDFARVVILMKYIGINPVIVHGGGPQIGKVLKQFGKESTFVNGMRVTDRETMDVVEMVLVGRVNQEIVGLINGQGGNAVGLSGKDANLIRGRKLVLKEKPRDADQKNGALPPEIIDLGRVGEVTAVNTGVLATLDRENFIPVIAPVAADENGETLNINADLVAGTVAEELKAEKLILLTDVEGVIVNGSLVSSITAKEASEMIDKGEITGGMIPKVECCISALEKGVKKTHIIDGRIHHSVLLELFTDGGIGTEIVPG
ncbi:MAG: acetylglutamate kinase [Deltaproteobacteria bacterium]|uniref:Acetylglutamate kinase n=1 Tax=Candidatus Zymogenus saltonus TaxID=2844893 RepID=A0A9D8KEJ4_9DELT|nr:acetylglutamate kinase [Candidatus Zymogenus saltonus]